MGVVRGAGNMKKNFFPLYRKSSTNSSLTFIGAHVGGLHDSKDIVLKIPLKHPLCDPLLFST